MFTAPIYWVNEKKTKKSTTHLVGMNFYRNAHYHIKNKMKKDISESIQKSIATPVLPIIDDFTVTYNLYYKNPSSDPSNIIALVEKIFLDMAQEQGLIENDSVKYHIGTSWKVVCQDKLNPRCEITILPAIDNIIKRSNDATN